MKFSFSFYCLLIAIICICRFEEAKQDDGSATISQQDKPKRKSKTTSRLTSSEESSLFLADEETTQPELGRSRRFKSSSKTVNRSGSGRSLNIGAEEDVDWADDDASSSSFNDDFTTEGALSSSSSSGSRDGFGRSVSGFGGSGATRRRQAPGTSSRQPSSSNTNSNSNSRSSFSQRSKVRESLRESLDNRRSDGPKISLPPKGLTSGFTPRDRQSSSSSSASRGFTPSSAADLEDIRPTASKKAASGSSSSSSFINPEKKPKVEFKKFDRFERPDIRKNLLNKFLKNRPAGGESNDTTTISPASATTTSAGSNEDGGSEEEEGLDDDLFFDDHESSPSALVPSIINDEDLLQHLGERPIKVK
jgi:hypothetical protein